jgi:hypothetical protein
MPAAVAFVVAACLAAPAGLHGDAAPAPRPPDQRPMVLRVHSLAGLVDGHGRRDATFGMLPYVDAKGGEEHVAELGEPPIHAEDLVMLVRETVDRALWDNGAASLTIADRDRLVVRAPAETQDRIAELLARLAGDLVASAVLEVRAVNLGYLEESPALVDRARADELEATRGPVVVRRLQLALNGRAYESASSFTSASTVFDWEPSIAQGASIGVPVARTVHNGLEVVAHATPAAGGMYVALAVREAESVAGHDVRSVEANSAIVAQQVVIERAAGGLVQHPRFGFVSYAGAAFLETGKALLIPVLVHTHVGDVVFTLDLRLAGEVPVARQRYDAAVDADDPLRLGLVGLGLAGLATPEFEPITPRLFDEMWNQDAPPSWTAAFEQRECAPLVEVAQTAGQPTLDQGHGSVALLRDYLRLVLPSGVIDDVGNALAVYDRHGDGTVSGRVVEGDRELARFRVPYVDERTLSLWCGAQGHRIAGFDGDVATDALVPNPHVEPWLDGVALQLTVSRDARGRAVVHANGSFCFLDGAPVKVDLRDGCREAVEQLHARRAWFDEQRALPDKGKARFGSGDLALELEVKPR